MRRRTLGTVALALGAFLCSCAADRDARPGAALPAPDELIDAWNANAARLDRVWARVVVSFRYDDPEGRRRYDQGDGHLQIRDASRVALSVGKLGETMLWLGCDDERFWLIDRIDEPVAYVGRLDALDAERRARLGLPVGPRELLRFVGVAPIDADPAGARVEPGADGAARLLVELDGGAWAFTFDPETSSPVRVQRLDPSGAPVLDAELTRRRSLRLHNVGGDLPKIPGRVRVTHVPSDSVVTMTIDGDPIDGRGSGRPRASAFDFETLRASLGPFAEVRDLDRAGAEASAGPAGPGVPYHRPR